MRILLESIKKGLDIAAQSLMSISEYMKNIHKVEQRLKDLLAEVISDMKGNMVFLAPLLSGIVVGLAAMISSILNKLYFFIVEMGSGTEALYGLDASMITTSFNILKMIPPYYLQIAIGIYILQIIFILTNVLVTIDAGDDKLRLTRNIGKNLKRGMLMYFIVAFISILLLSLLAGAAIGGLAG